MDRGLTLAFGLVLTLVGVALIMRRSFFRHSQRYQLAVAAVTICGAGLTSASLMLFALKGLG